MTEIKLKPCLCAEDAENRTMAKLKQYFLKMEPNEEVGTVCHFLHILEYRQVIVFVRNPMRCETLSNVLNEHGHPSTFIHEEMTPKVRICSYVKFQRMEGSSKILVTSSGLGHAMDLPCVDICINFDEILTPTVYLHRVSSRIVRKGLVINFIRNNNHRAEITLKQVESLYKVDINPLPDVLCSSMYR